jgi:hypothetical protein
VQRPRSGRRRRNHSNDRLHNLVRHQADCEVEVTRASATLFTCSFFLETIQMTEPCIPASPSIAPPPGYVLAKTPDGRRYWVDPHRIVRNATRRSELTKSQIHRIRAFKKVLGEHDRSTLEVAIRNFRADQHPEKEIRIWERIASVYQQELIDRPKAKAADRQLLYRTLVHMSLSPTLDSLVSSVPEAKRLGHLQRIWRRYVEPA